MRDYHLWGDDDDGGEARPFLMTRGNLAAVFGLGMLMSLLLELIIYLMW